jgi:Chaperone of endosialidase
MKRLAKIMYSALAGVCVALHSEARAVITDPEGYFPGWNTAEGQSALFSLTTGFYNTALGGVALYSNTTGNNNTAVGLNALFRNNTGSGNTGMGAAALYFNTWGNFNTATGTAALRSNTAGNWNTANGYHALYFNTIGNSNTANGPYALHSNTTGSENTAGGAQALYSNTTGYQNTAIGRDALLANTIGYQSTAIGSRALRDSTGHGNTAVGDLAGARVTTASNVICIGRHVYGENVSHSCWIGNIWGATGGSEAVYVNAAGRVGTQVSSQRFKDEIKPMQQASEVIYGLKPVSFRYKPEIEPARLVGFGLIAEEVEKINPDLVSRDREGKPLSVRYDQVNAMLLNEFLKHHQRVEKQQSKIDQQQAAIAELKLTAALQQKQIQALTESLKQQASQLQQVTARIKVSKFATGRIRRGGPAPQLVLNNP